MVGDGIVELRARLLALGVGFWAALQTVPPILAILRAKIAVAGLPTDPQTLPSGFGAAFLASANPVQLLLWLAAGVLFALSALSLAGVRVGPARDYYGVGLLVEAAVWATFRRAFAYGLLPATARLAVCAVLGLLALGYLLVVMAERPRQSGRRLGRRAAP
jgi:hypothetical protein